MNEYNFHQIWTSKLIEARRRLRIKNPLIASLLFFGLPGDLLFLGDVVVTNVCTNLNLGFHFAN